jgi:hypothetical protein
VGRSIRWAALRAERRDTTPAEDSRRTCRCSRLALAVCLALTLGGGTALAAEVSARDGFGPNGNYQWNFELDPYLWLPAANASFATGRNDRFSTDVTAGVPSVSELANSLHGAFMGAAITRYGPYSGELDFQWVDASQGTTAGPDRNGRTAHLSASASYVRVAPGLGYQVYNGALGSMPVTVDARAGFAWFSWSTKVSSEFDPVGVSPGGSFIQPWLGFRVSVFPADRWRVELAALGQGFGVSGGSWGWGTSLIGTYSFNSWFDANLGFRALNSTRNDSNAGLFGTRQRSLDFTAYGPVLGVGFRF